MRRFELFEIHDHRWCPAILRNLFTDALQAIWMMFDSYRPIVPLLRQALEKSGTNHVIDLCSGAGGPWLQLARNFEEEQAYKVTVLLTDLHPNTEGFERASSECKYLNFYAQPVSALEVPRDFSGFRTIFSSFHHFSPNDARRILWDAATHRHGIAIFEGAKEISESCSRSAFFPWSLCLLRQRFGPSAGHELSGPMSCHLFRLCSGLTASCHAYVLTRRLNYSRCQSSYE